MSLKAGRAEMHSGAIVLAILSGQRVRIRPFESDARLPKALLRLANWRRRRTLGRIADLSDKPGKIPTSLAPRRADNVFQHPPVIIAGDLVFGLLISVRLSLVPEQSAKAATAQLVDSFHHAVKEFAAAFQGVGGVRHHKFRVCRRHFNSFSFEQPVPHAGAAVAYGGHRDGDVISLIKRIAEGRNKTALCTVVLHSGLGIVGDAPGVSAERNHHSRFGLLAYFTVVGGVGLSRNHKNFSHSYVWHRGLKDWLAGFQRPKLEFVESSSRHAPLGAKGM